MVVERRGQGGSFKEERCTVGHVLWQYCGEKEKV